MHRRHAAKARARHRAAVVGIFAADNYLFLVVSQALPVVADHPDHGVVGFRARIGKKDMIQMPGRDLGQQGRQFDHRRMGGLKETVVVGQLFHLAFCNLCKIFSSVANVHAPESGHAV